MRQVSVTIARAFFCQLITSDENKYFICYFSSYAYMGVMYRARHLKERKKYRTDARIDSEGRFFSPSETCCLESSFRVESFLKDKGRGANINTKNTLLLRE